MARDITVTFDDGTQHVYRGAPDDITPDAVQQRASREFGKAVQHLDGGRGVGGPAAAARPALDTESAAAPAAKPGGFLQQVGNTAAGLVRGAGSIGATLLAPIDIASDALDGKGLSLESNRQRRAAMDGGLQAMGADPDSTMYQVGKLTGEVAGTLPVGGIVGRGVTALGAPRLGAAVTSAGFRTGAPAATTLAGRAGDIGIRATGGAISGGLTAAAVDPSQALTGAAVGAAVPQGLRVLGAAGSVAGRAAGAAGRGVRAAIEPFTEGGRKAIASRVLVQAAGDQAPAVAGRLAQAAELVPGSVPTAAQIAESGGVAALERTMAAAQPSAFTERALDQSVARIAALQGIAGDDAARAAAVQARDAVTGPMYDQATRAVYTMDDRLQGLLQTPAMRQALARAEVIAKNQQRPFTFTVEPPDLFSGLGNNRVATSKQITGQGLQDLKMALDEMLTDPAGGYAGAAGASIKQLRGKLLNWMEDANAAFRNARTTYAEMSKPIGQMDVGRELLEKLEPALADYGAMGRETAARYASALRNADQTARQATKFRGTGMRDLMTPEQMAVMENIAADLARKSNAETLGRGVGSDTFQKLAMGNLATSTGLSPKAAAALPGKVGAVLGASLGGAVAGVPGGVAGAGLGKALEALYGVAEGKIQQAVGQSLLQPRTAAAMMQEELAKRALASQARQPLLSDQTRDAIGVLFGRSSPLVLSAQ